MSRRRGNFENWLKKDDQYMQGTCKNCDKCVINTLNIKTNKFECPKCHIVVGEYNENKKTNKILACIVGFFLR